MFEDLKNFFLYGEENCCITNQFYYIFKRYYMFNNMEYIQIANYVYKKYTKTDKKPKNKFKFLWGLLTINERKKFTSIFFRAFGFKYSRNYYFL